jgi:hypothetical protein
MKKMGKVFGKKKKDEIVAKAGEAKAAASAKAAELDEKHGISEKADKAKVPRDLAPPRSCRWAHAQPSKRLIFERSPPRGGRPVLAPLMLHTRAPQADATAKAGALDEQYGISDKAEKAKVPPPCPCFRRCSNCKHAHPERSFSEWPVLKQPLTHAHAPQADATAKAGAVDEKFGISDKAGAAKASVQPRAPASFMQPPAHSTGDLHRS